MSSAVSLQLDSKDLSDQLTKLFPKCRPRDLNLNLSHVSPSNSVQALDNSPFVMELRKQINRYGRAVQHFLFFGLKSINSNLGCTVQC